MSPPSLPPDRVAQLVSAVTQTLVGMTFAADARPVPAQPSGAFRVALLPIPGSRLVTVALASDEPSCAALAARMFQVPPGEVDATMIDDMLSELANITAGRLKGAMALDQALGLPQILQGPQDLPSEPGHQWSNVLLRSGPMHLWVSIGGPR